MRYSFANTAQSEPIKHLPDRAMPYNRVISKTMQNGNVFRFEDKNLVDLFIFLKGIKTAEVLQSGVDIVLKDRSLIP